MERSEVSAGGVVYRRTPGGGGFELLLGEQTDRVTGRTHVRLPKGKPDRGERIEDAALREVREETGVAARLEGALGDVSYTYTERDGSRVAKRVHFFLMESLGQPPGEPDGELTRVFWCPAGEADVRLDFDTEREVVARARRALGAAA